MIAARVSAQPGASMTASPLSGIALLTQTPSQTLACQVKYTDKGKDFCASEDLKGFFSMIPKKAPRETDMFPHSQPGCSKAPRTCETGRDVRNSDLDSVKERGRQLDMVVWRRGVYFAGSLQAAK